MNPTAAPPTEPPVEPPVEPPETPPAEPKAPFSYVDENGNFKEGWKEGLDEEIRGEICLDTVKDIKGLASRFVHNHRKFGKNSIVKPDENSSQEDWDEFNKARGRPETVGDYKYTKVDGIEYDDAMINTFLEGAHRRGFNQEDIDFLSELDNNRILQMMQVNKDNIKAAKDEAEDALRTELGVAYDERIHLANRVWSDDRFVPEEEREEFIKKYGNNVDVIRFSMRVGERLQEHKEVSAPITEPSKGEAQTKIDELMATPGYFDQNSDMLPVVRKRITEQIRQLQLKINPPEKKT